MTKKELKEKMDEMARWVYEESDSIYEFINVMYTCGLTYEQTCEYIGAYVTDEWKNEPTITKALATFYGRS